MDKLRHPHKTPTKPQQQHNIDASLHRDTAGQDQTLWVHGYFDQHAFLVNLCYAWLRPFSIQHGCRVHEVFMTVTSIYSLLLYQLPLVLLKLLPGHAFRLWRFLPARGCRRSLFISSTRHAGKFIPQHLLHEERHSCVVGLTAWLCESPPKSPPKMFG